MQIHTDTCTWVHECNIYTERDTVRYGYIYIYNIYI